jgi:subtilisin family serine protease
MVKKSQKKDIDSKQSQYNGFIIVNLAKDISSIETNDLFDLAKKKSVPQLSSLLDKYRSKVTIKPLITSIPPSKTLELEQKNTTENSLASFWRIDSRKLSSEQAEDLVKSLNELSEVSFAYREMSASDPLVDPSDDTYYESQGYLNSAPEGVDAKWAWNLPNGNGKGVALIDLEQGWFQNHEDLIEKQPTLIFNDNRNGIDSYKGDHGTAVLGELVGVDNNLGVLGIAHGVSSVRMVSHYEQATNTSGHVADAVLAAVANMSAGDVLLLEVQKSFLPTETEQADFVAIQTAVNNGIIVIEAAGNGNVDLDNWQNPWSFNNTTLNRNSPNFLDSNAIMVGAAESNVPHDRVGASNFGSRVDCYGWGENVTTAGYGDLDPGTGDNSTYTGSFENTSSASPIVTGVALVLQSLNESQLAIRLTPSQMRVLLSNPSTGTPQGPNVAGNIGVMPNLRALIENRFNTNISKINVKIKTGNMNGAGTNGRVYLGIGGREFRLDQPGNQFEQGDLDTFTIGTGSNIENASINDLPTFVKIESPIIRHLDILLFPKYIRFDPNDKDDNWNVEKVEVEVVNIARTYRGPRDGNVWLGSRSGISIQLN